MTLKHFIERPVLASVISIVIVIAGLIGLATLPVEQYPDIAPPTVMVRASYPGASAETIQKSVIVPLEQAINGVEDMTYMTSSAAVGSARPGRFAAVWRAAAAVAVVCATFFGARLYDRLLLERATERYTVTTKSGDRSTVCLPDGTQVRLNGSSTLTYPANFNATNRSVELSGAAYFDVSPDEKHRFEVKVGNCSVVVKGTKFDVTAYPDDSLITTTLLEGAVGFTAPRGETLLRPGESLTYDRFAETTAITHVNTAQYLAWIEGRIEFIDVTIVQLCESLSSLYGVEITLDDRLRADGTFITIRLSNQESLDSVLKALDLIVPVSVHRQGPSVRLSAK